MLTNAQIEQAKSVDLVGMVEKDIGPGKRSGRWVMFRCPFHADHDPSLAVTNGDSERVPVWVCFGCGKHGDSIGWLKEYRGIGFQEAVQDLAEGHLPSMPRQVKPYREATQAPGDKWQERARRLIERAQEILWRSDEPGLRGVEWSEVDPLTGEVKTVVMSALDWLLARGLTESTLKLWQIGFIPMGFEHPAEKWGLEGKPVWFPPGILIPCVVNDKVWYLKVRRPKSHPKYVQVRGSRPAIFMVQTMVWQTDAVLCEGEFDAMLLQQEAGDLAAVATLGSAGYDLDLPTWGLHLLNIQRWFLAYDLDQSGREGAERLSWLRLSKQLAIPQLKPGDKDLTDYFKSGGDLRQWLVEELARG